MQQSGRIKELTILEQHDIIYIKLNGDREVRLMKKMLVIQSSGKAKGNTAQLAESFAKGAIEKGHSVEVVSLV